MRQVDLTRYRWIPQRQGDYCILTAIENALAYLNLVTWSQERIYEEWKKWYALKASPDWNGIPPFDLESPSLFLPETELGELCDFFFYDGQGGQEQALTEIIDGLSGSEPVPVIASVNILDPERGWRIAHMYVVLAIAGHVVLYHDPDPRPRRVPPSYVQLPLLLSALGEQPHLLRIVPKAPPV